MNILQAVYSSGRPDLQLVLSGGLSVCPETYVMKCEEEFCIGVGAVALVTAASHGLY
jgi:hypothetical protein